MINDDNARGSLSYLVRTYRYDTGRRIRTCDTYGVCIFFLESYSGSKFDSKDRTVFQKNKRWLTNYKAHYQDNSTMALYKNLYTCVYCNEQHFLDNTTYHSCGGDFCPECAAWFDEGLEFCYSCEEHNNKQLEEEQE